MRLAVFDVDGTLVDSQHNIVAAMTVAVTAVGRPAPSPAAIRHIIGLSVDDALGELVPDADAAVRHGIVERFRREFFAMRARRDFSEPLFDGAIAALTGLADQGWLLGLATGKSRAGVDALLKRHGLEGRFITLQTADGNPSKPHPAMVLRAVEETGTDKDATVMVGDTAYDMAMARAAGTRGVGVAWGYHPRGELLAAGADAICEAFPGLPTLLSDLVAGKGQP